MHDPIKLQGLVVRIVPGLQPNTPKVPGHVAVTYTFEIAGHVPMRDGAPARYHLMVEEGHMRDQDLVRRMVETAAHQDLADLLAERPSANLPARPGEPGGIEQALSLLQRFGESSQDPRQGVPDHELVADAIAALEGEADDPSEVTEKRETGRTAPGYVWTLRNGLAVTIEKALVNLPRGGTERVLVCDVLTSRSGLLLAEVTLHEAGKFVEFVVKYTRRAGEDLQRVNEALRALVREAGPIGSEWW